MGISWSSNTNSTSIEKTVDLESNEVEVNYNYDDLEPKILFEMIRSMNPKKLDLTNFKDLTKDVQIENTRLIPMCIELYKKLEKVLPEYVPDKTTTKRKYKVKFTKPEFKVEDLIARNDAQITSEFDPNVIEDLMALYKDLESKYPYNCNLISLEEYNESFKEFDNKSDMIGLNKNVLGHFTDYHKRLLINAFNRIFKNEEQAIALMKATFIFKGTGKNQLDKTMIGNYREIGVIPIITNHFHRILSLRLNNHLIRNGFLNTTIQKGGVQGQTNPLVQQILKVKTSIKHARMHSKKLALLFLDIKNAYGSVNRHAMFAILEKFQVDPNFIAYLRNYYNNLEYYVQTKEITSPMLKWKEGLTQGDPLSGTLFNMVFTYVLNYIDILYKETYGYELSENIKLLLLAFVDDVAVATNSVEHAISVFIELEKVCRLIGLTFGKPKCFLMLINHPEFENVNEYQGFQIKKTVKYLGAYINSDGESEENFGEFQKMLYARMKKLAESKKMTNEEKFMEFNKVILPKVNMTMRFMYDVSDEKKAFVRSCINGLLKGFTEKRVKFSSFETDMFEIDDEIVKAIISDNVDAQYYKSMKTFEYKDEGIDVKELNYNEVNDLDL